MPDTDPNTMLLRRGSSSRLQAPRGTILHAVRGTIVIHGACTWIGESLLTPSDSLREGEAMTLPSTGWFTLTACADAELMIVEPAPRLQRLWRQWREAWTSALRRRRWPTVAAREGS